MSSIHWSASTPYGSVAMYIMTKYIRENTDTKIIFSGIPHTCTYYLCHSISAGHDLPLYYTADAYSVECLYHTCSTIVITVYCTDSSLILSFTRLGNPHPILWVCRCKCRKHPRMLLTPLIDVHNY